MFDDLEVPLRILSMIARQIRILIQVKELADERQTDYELGRRLRIHSYSAKRGRAQARSFTMTQLEAAHQQIVDTDWAIKSGETDPQLALELLVVRLTAN
jgi:DNA polymerase-3 subunit delta